LFFALTILLTPELQGQNSAAAPSARLDQIQEQRSKKAESLAGQQSATEEKPSRVGHIVRLLPISFEVGGLGPGAGPAVNSVLRKTTDEGHLSAAIMGHLAVHSFYSVGTGAQLRFVSKHDLSVGLEGSYSNAPQLEYYGPGPNSSIHNRTDFRREQTLVNVRVGLRTHLYLAEACRIGQLWPHIGPGTNDDLATTQSVFGPAQAPGIDNQSSYLIVGCSVQLDLRDFPEDPHHGTYASATFDRYYAETLRRFSFYRLSPVGEQYIPFFNRKRVIALRAKTELSFHDDDQVVPFYLQPTLGSDTELRGFRRYRFYDENSISLTAEYRWEISTGFEMALFVDGGNVFNRPGQIVSTPLQSSVGFGFRFKNQNERKVVARLDTGFSREGVQVWLKIPELF
jgi:hypothetical protein